MEKYDEIGLAEENYLAAWRLLASSDFGGAVVETEKMLFACASVPVQYFNIAFVKPHVNPAGCVDAAKSFFADRGTPFTFRFRNDGAFTPDDVLESAGLTLDGSSPLMVAASADIGGVGDYEVVPVNESSWHAHVATMADGFGMPLDLVESVMPVALATSRHYAGFNASVNGTVVSTSALIVSHGVAGVYNVATPEAYRGRGFGGATTRAAVAEGVRRGCTHTTLQASEMGFSLYAEMGYRTVIQWRNFVGA